MTTPPHSERPRPAESAQRPGPGAAGTEVWHALESAAVLKRLGTTEAGLSAAEAAARRAHFGPNVLPRSRRAGLVLIYLRQFKNPLVYLLLMAALVSLLVGEPADAAFIFVVLQFNAVIGTLQEWRAEASAEALSALIQKVATLIRDGTRQAVDAAELVPGDIVALGSGALAPADLRLLSSAELSVDESLLTGESTSVGKEAEALLGPETPLAERRNMLFAGTTLLAGRALGVVVATGLDTQVGRIAESLLAAAPPPPPLVRRLERFSRRVGVATVVLIAVLAAVQLMQGLSLATVFLVAVALAVAAIPEGLPVAITVALAIATNRMARRNVIVRALPAVEGLGACTMIASDKTGTLTCNELTIQRVRLHGPGLHGPGLHGLAAPADDIEVSGEGYAPQGEVGLSGAPLPEAAAARLRALAVSGALCNEASLRFSGDGVERLGDTVDLAFLVLAAKLGLDHEALRAAHPQLGLIAYEPQRRYAASFVGADMRVAVHVKGAAEVILPMCADVDADRATADAARLAAAGYRVLAVARGALPAGADGVPGPEALHGLEFLGLVGLIDPLRPEAAPAIARCREAGIDVRMVTGDHPETALAIGRRLGMAESASQVVTGGELSEAAGETAEFDRLVAGARIFARVEPVQKLAIVQALQRAGETVAVTGDGVNDAPALAAANIGVAMGEGGTDVARGAADLILTDDNFASIVAGVEEGRIAYDNVRKLIFLLITTGLGEIVLFLLAIAAGLPVPLFAVQLLWLNLVTNGIQDVALAFEKGEPGVLGRPPRPPKQDLFDRRMIFQVLASGIYMGVVAFGFYAWCLARGVPEFEARNLLLLLMVLFENVHAINARSETRSAFAVPLRANPFLVLAVLAAQGLHVAAFYQPSLGAILSVRPIGLTDWLPVAGLALSLLVFVELLKRRFSVGPARRRGDA